MIKKKLYFLLTAFLAVQIAHAADLKFKQTVTVCMSADKMVEALRLRFISTDTFENEKKLDLSSPGADCKQHIYKQGPKNIKLTFSGGVEKGRINIGKSCSFMYPQGSALVSDRIETHHPNETWWFHLIQNNNPMFQYDLSCEYISY